MRLSPGSCTAGTLLSMFSCEPEKVQTGSVSITQPDCSSDRMKMGTFGSSELLKKPPKIDQEKSCFFYGKSVNDNYIDNICPPVHFLRARSDLKKPPKIDQENHGKSTRSFSRLRSEKSILGAGSKSLLLSSALTGGIHRYYLQLLRPQRPSMPDLPVRASDV